MHTDWLAIFTIATFSIVGFLVAAFVAATLLTSLSKRNRRAFEARHHRSKRRNPNL